MLKQKGLAKEILEALNEHQVAGNVLEELNTSAIATMNGCRNSAPCRS